MKNSMRSILIILLSIVVTKAQPPQGINYQGIARDNQGHPLINHNIGIKLSILDSSATGQPIYIETHNKTTSNTDLFNLSIGLGSIVSGTFTAIPWGNGEKWLQIEMDTSGGSNFSLIGTTQFLSVPYAIHAQTANSLISPSQNGGVFTMFSQESPAVNMGFWEATDYCRNLIEGGFDDWRLPSYDEVKKYVQIYGLPPSRLVTFTTTESYFNGYSIIVILNDPNNVMGYGLNNTINVQQGAGNWPHKIQCVR